jgi:N,N'-diacetyllegionaminate synthase
LKFNITGKRKIGDEESAFIIAEIGNNHQGNMELAKKAIISAEVAGADAVSFQYAPLSSYCIKGMYSHPNLSFLQECEFSIEQLQQLVDEVHGRNMACSINVEDNDMLDSVLGLDIDFIKLCSADLTNKPYIQYCASKNKPVFFSTGAAYLGEIERAYNFMLSAGLKEFVIYHTNSGYPTAIADANLLQMDLLHGIFGGVKGYCDHTVDIIPAVVAVSRGAKVVEKHITTDRSLKGDDWMVSLEPDEFKLMVSYIREAELSLGNKYKVPLESESGTREFKRKSIVTRVQISKGTTFSEELFTYKLPGTGIAPYALEAVLGKKAVKDIDRDVVLQPEMIQDWL